MSYELTEVDMLLSRKYKEMAGYFNIVNINDNTILSGSVTIFGNLYISGASILYNTVNIGDSVNVTNDIYVNNISTLNVVTEDFNIRNITTNNDIFIKGDLNISGSLETNSIYLSHASFDANLFVSSHTTINNNIYVNTIKSYNNSLSINSDKINFGTDNSIININGTSITLIQSNKISSDKNIILNNNNNNNGGDCGIEILSNSNIAYIKTLPDASRFIIKTPLDINPKYLITFDNNENLVISGYSYLKKNVTINSTLNVNGDILFNDRVNINSNLLVSNTTTIYGNVTILGNIYIDKMHIIEGNSTSLGNLYVNGDSILDKVQINSNLNIADDTYINDTIYINSSFMVSGNTKFKESINCLNDLYIKNNTIIKGDVLCKKNVNFLDNVVINASVNVGNDLLVTGNNIHENTLTVLSNVLIGGNVNLKKNSIMGSDKDTTISGEDTIFQINGNIICPLSDFESNSVAAFNNVPTWGFYRTGGIVKVRLDVIPPEIYIYGSQSYDIQYGYNFDDPGVSVHDNQDNYLIPYLTSLTSLTNNINILINPINMDSPGIIPEISTLNIGSYILLYVVSDIIGNTATTQRFINII